MRNGYCKDVRTKIADIKFEHFVGINENLKDNNSPGIDLITGYWIKRSRATRETTFNIFKKINNREDTITEWSIKTKTTLIAKNKETQNSKNYRPIACENIMMKTYAGTLAKLIEEHLIENSIVYSEQAGAKKGLWGCTDQLLINRVVTDEAMKGRRNLSMIWLDYKKAYDSVPHSWIIEALRLAKIPDTIIAAVQHLISRWSTEINIPASDGNVRIGDIIYNKGALQGDYLSVILFILSLNPLSFLLSKTEGFKMGLGTVLEKIITHVFFVDDSKLFVSSLDQSKLQLDIVTQFSKDIGMEFGEDKCGYIYILQGVKESHKGRQSQ